MERQTDIRQWLLERAALDELPEGSTLEGFDRDSLKRGLEELARSDKEILGTYPPSVMVEKIRRRAQAAEAKRASPARRGWMAVPALAAVLVLCVFAWWKRPVQIDGVSGLIETVRLKGLRPRLHIYRQRGLGKEELRDGAIAHTRDVLQLSYAAAGQRYGFIFSIDGRGHVTFHHPPREDMPDVLKPSGEILLSQSYVLDDAPHFERFYFVTSTEPIDINAVLAAARGSPGDRLPLPSGLEQFVVTLNKAVP